MTLEAICTYLERMNISALTAETGKDALDISRRERPDIILLEINCLTKTFLILFLSDADFFALARQPDIHILASMACHCLGKYLFQIIITARGFVVGAI